MKKVLAEILVLSILVCCVGCSGGSLQKFSDFYEKVSESKDLLDSVADDIYSNWYDAIYEDEFDEDIDLAIASAKYSHISDLERIEELETEISDLFKSLKNDEENGDLVKEVMSAYSDYYEFVVNVSGSFNTYSAEKETLKKELASALKDLSYEI